MFDFFRITPKKRTIGRLRGRGVLYRNPPFVGKIAFVVGNMLFLIAITYIGYLYYPLSVAIFRYEVSQVKSPTTRVTTSYPTPTQDITKPDEYVIEIPKILAKSEIARDVSPFDAGEYLKVLEKDIVAQAKGSAMPGAGIGKSTYIFAHSTQQGIGMARKNAVFYLLGELKNDDVIFVKHQGQIYTYRVYKQEVVAPSQVEYLSYTEPDKEILLLQTCWPLGTDWKRLIVFAKRSDY